MEILVNNLILIQKYIYYIFIQNYMYLSDYL